MTLTLDLPVEVETRLHSEAVSRGLSIEELAFDKLISEQSQPDKNSIVALAERIRAKYSGDKALSFPADFAINHDHYIHGARKVEHRNNLGISKVISKCVKPQPMSARQRVEHD